ncbi:E3 ubiquitin- ligase At1g63170 [Olea europaea subsp. europaea]|uniref:E3 ubiquitin- ligase At1g63170 n=1 Tax=Olea europaea subsp. europaea TaxID=158383 RepID=A0A8S0RKK5_OLEEU|nr:E3 ubiquitin- ligase At1g63170 [Olea europaea subsp. europaea]
MGTWPFFMYQVTIPTSTTNVGIGLSFTETSSDFPLIALSSSLIEWENFQWLKYCALSALNTRETDNLPLLMERADDHIHDEHVIEITGSDASSSTLSQDRTSHGIEQHQNAIVVLSLSRHERPHAPLKTWVVGYASGCVAILPLLYWRFRYRNHGSEQDSTQHVQDSSQNNFSAGTSSRRISEGEDHQTTGTTSSGGPNVSPRLRALVEYFKMGLDCFFAVWFVVGNVWIFGGHSSSTDAPNLYRLCIVFLTFSCIGYAMPFILCATICCCLPCIISVLGFREDLAQNRGATQESINSLPTYKFKVKKNKNSNKESNSATDEAGIVAAGTENERVVSAEDAVCCICLAKYVNNDELRELPCSHFFHKECVDKWLKINASCPLCKAEVGETILSSLTEATASLRQRTML